MSTLATSMYVGRTNNRYCLPKEFADRNFMPGRENLGDLLDILDTRLRATYETEFVITKALSGLHQMDVIMSVMRKLASRIVILDKFYGGHTKTELVSQKYGFETESVKLDLETWDIAYSDLDRILAKWKDERAVMYLDHTVGVNPIDIQKLLDAVPSDWLVYYDISHLQLFYFAGIYTLPHRKNFFFGGSTHKTFPGPQKAIILLNDGDLCGRLNAEFDSVVSSTHTGSLLALLITVLEMEVHGKEYASRIIELTRYLAGLLGAKLEVVGPMPHLTNTHQICIDVENYKDVTLRLAEAGITTMPTKIPGKYRYGLRLGIQEQCRSGISKKDVLLLSKILLAAILYEEPVSVLKKKVEALTEKLSSVRYTDVS